MKRSKYNNGATFIEVILAMVILAIIIIPFMSAFVFAERGTVEAGDVLDASFVAQRRLEELSALDFRSAVDAGNRIREPYSGVFVEVSAVPYHPANPIFFNIVAQDTSGRRLLVTTPTGGEVRVLGSINSNVAIILQITTNSYSVTVPGQSVLNGILPTSGNVLVMLNATQYTGSHEITLNIQSGRRTDAHVYTSFTNDSEIFVTGLTGTLLRRFVGFTNRNFSMLRARVSVYESMRLDALPTAVMESILELPN